MHAKLEDLNQAAQFSLLGLMQGLVIPDVVLISSPGTRATCEGTTLFSPDGLSTLRAPSGLAYSAPNCFLWIQMEIEHVFL